VLILGVLQVERFWLIDDQPQSLRTEAILSCRIRVVVKYILLQLPIRVVMSGNCRTFSSGL
jgi:hypothetical protein